MSERTESAEGPGADGLLDEYLNVHCPRPTARGGRPEAVTVEGEVVRLGGRRIVLPEEVARWCLRRS